jgi:hypothetical protein
MEAADFGGIDGLGPPLVDAFGLGLLDPVALAFAPDVGLELGEGGEDVEQKLPVRPRCIDGSLLETPEGDALDRHLVDDLAQIHDRAGKAAEPCDHQWVAIADELQRILQGSAVLGAGPVLLLGEDLLATSHQ